MIYYRLRPLRLQDQVSTDYLRYQVNMFQKPFIKLLCVDLVCCEDRKTNHYFQPPKNG